MYLERATGRAPHIEIRVEIEEQHLTCPATYLTIVSKPLTRWEIYKMDEALGPEDVKVQKFTSLLTH